MGKILIFYKYVSIEYPKRILKWQQELCANLKLRGRILLAQEGINATVGGSQEHIEHYVTAMRKHPLFADIDYKQSEGDNSHFPRMQITIKKEIVNFGISREQLGQTGKYLSPHEVHQLLENKPDNLIILDARNNFESAIGRFEEAVTPNIDYFRDLPSYIDQHAETFKDKQVLMYCTAGIRCEKATSYLTAKGIAQEVYQIEGGIHKYIEAYPNGFFKGKNYVFDGRVAVPVTQDILSTCALCPTSCDEYTNCLNAQCNNHFICCAPCITAFDNCCSTECQQLLNNNQVAPRPQRQKQYNTCSIEPHDTP